MDEFHEVRKTRGNQLCAVAMHGRIPPAQFWEMLGEDPKWSRMIAWKKSTVDDVYCECWAWDPETGKIDKVVEGTDDSIIVTAIDFRKWNR